MSMPTQIEFEEVSMPCMSKKMSKNFTGGVAGYGDNADKCADSAGGKSLADTEEGAGKRC